MTSILSKTLFLMNYFSVLVIVFILEIFCFHPVKTCIFLAVYFPYKKRLKPFLCHVVFFFGSSKENSRAGLCLLNKGFVVKICEKYVFDIRKKKKLLTDRVKIIDRTRL